MTILRTLLENNLSRNRALTAEHGLSFLVETGGKKILFDCGAGKAARKNAEKMHVSLKDVDYVVLSHSHYDHAAGYPDMVSHGVHAPLVTGPYFFEEKYAREGGKYAYLGCGFGPEFLDKKGIARQVCEGSLTLFDGCHVVGGFERTYAFEKAPARFVRQTAAGMTEDDFPDEVCLAVETVKGLVVIAGCSHPGILNMLETVKKRLDMPAYVLSALTTAQGMRRRRGCAGKAIKWLIPIRRRETAFFYRKGPKGSGNAGGTIQPTLPSPFDAGASPSSGRIAVIR